MARRTQHGRPRRFSALGILLGAGIVGAATGFASIDATVEEQEMALSPQTDAGLSAGPIEEHASEMPSLAATPMVGEGRNAAVASARDIGVAAGVMRRREPREGDHWGGCNDARAAGTAPIYLGEPGYREDMDGDQDGIACEVPQGY